MTTDPSDSSGSSETPGQWRLVDDSEERAAQLAKARARVTSRQADSGSLASAPQDDVGEVWIGENPAVVVWLINQESRTILADVAGEDLTPQQLLTGLATLAQKQQLDFSEYAGDAFAVGLAAASDARRTATKMRVDVNEVPEPTGIGLRPMDDSDYAAYREHADRAFAEDWLASGLAANLDEALQVAREQMSELMSQGLQTPGNHLFTVRDDDDRRVGILWLHFNDRRGFIYDIEIDVAERGRGYGTQTLRAAAAETRAAGPSILALNVFGSNDDARRLYAKEGYRETEILWSATVGEKATHAEPSRTVEVERKYDVEVATPLPTWDAIAGVDAVTSGELRELDAQYFDTADAALSRSGVALRRRTGGPDEGWHIKGPREGDGRLELGWPLGDEDTVPDAVSAAIARWTTEPLTPLARIRNDRTAYLLTGSDGVVAEFVDDRVRATDLRSGIEREWREWEMELGPAAPADALGREEFFSAVESAIFAVGGRDSASGSKLARALGF